jgi:RNA polymerase sigma factor (sigma-70 family)
VKAGVLGRSAPSIFDGIVEQGIEDLAAVPSRGRASRIEGELAPEADATRALYEQYANQVFRYCLHQLGSREEAEDAVQSTFLNAFRGIKRGVVPDLEAAWLFKIAHNVCLSRRRSAWRRGRIESPADFDVIEELAPAPSRRADELIGLQDVLERLPETQRRAILLREWQGLSYREIAAELELSQSAVETLIFRARRSLASGLDQPEKKRRVAKALDWGNVLAGLKTALVGGSAAAKIAATVAVVSASTVVAAAPVQQHQRHHHQQSAVVAKAHVGAASVTRAGASRTTSIAAAQARSHHAARLRAHGASVSLTAPAPEQSVPVPAAPAAPAPTPAPAETPVAPTPAPTDQVPEREPSSAVPAQPVPQPATTTGLTLAPPSQQPILDPQPIATPAPAVVPTTPQVGTGGSGN